MKKNTIYQGDCIDVLKTFPDESIDCVVTSPPYWGLRDYGTAEWEGGDEDCNHIEQKCLASDKNTLAGGKKGNQVTNISMQYKSECKKCCAVRKDSQLGLEETPEEFVENLVKVFSEVKRVLKKEGTVWLNLGDSYASNGTYINSWYKKEENKNKKNLHTENKERYSDRKAPRGGKYKIKGKDLVGIPWRVAFALQSDGWYLRQDIIWHKPNPMPESVQDRCTKSHEYIFLLSKSPKYFYDIDAIKEKSQDLGNTNIKFGGNKYGDSDEKHHQTKSGNKYVDSGMRNKRSVWTITTKPYKEAHFATFPMELPTYCIKAGCPKGGVVLDPFFGSGTTGLAAKEQHRNYVGIDLNPEYIEIAERRLQQMNLFI